MTILTSRRALIAGTALAVPFIRTAAAAEQTLEWVAGSLGGGWYTMAAGLATIIQEENPEIRIRVVPGGGLANATRINNGQSQIGWGIDAFAANAVKGEEPYTFVHDKLRSLGTGYSPTDHYLLRKADGGPTTMREILLQPGLKIGVPQRSSTDEMTLQRILKFIGSSPDAIRSGGGRYLNGSYADLTSAFVDGQVDYVYVALARPAAMLIEIAQGRRAGQLVAFPDDIRNHLSERYSYAQSDLPVGVYPALQTVPLKLTAMDSVVLVNSSIPDATVQAIAKTLIGAKGARMTAIHASMAAFDPKAAAAYTGVPLHPGAAAAFRAAGALA
ncbi:TRAP transporter TAXI family solute receptor [Humitalea rosea]|uniref:TRAP transporter TAXI family solute receptor n=1 Tax=Humitalea rosea TaxID=990373 RepID=A0A2W7IR83_9PROT|nr:TAXI family TRAP transporter solute-binding subunit [Humitalea rosea]PZW48803.1 TRAP transporter TAXI family solute receptor [Humitalea rosea]